MQSLALALKVRGEEGKPLPAAIPRLDGIGVKLRRSQLSLIAGAPGGGKSALAINMITRMRYEDGRGVPTLYFSADADRTTVATGVIAGRLGKTQGEVERMLDQEVVPLEVEKALEEATSHVWWSFDTVPGMHDITEEMEAYAYVHGEYPHLVVVDNLMDVAEAEENIGALSNVQIYLKGVARTTGCHMMVLAHVTGEYTNGDIPIPRRGLMFKQDKKAELVLTLYKVQDGLLGIRVVKNRNGEAWTDASFGINLPWMPNLGWMGS